jgi:hypothetical protein
MLDGRTYYPAHVLALKFWVVLHMMYGLAGPEEQRKYAALGQPMAQGQMGFLAFANHVVKYHGMFAHMQAAGIMPPLEIFVRGLNSDSMRDYARTVLGLHAGPALTAPELAEKLQAYYALQEASEVAGQAVAVYSQQQQLAVAVVQDARAAQEATPLLGWTCRTAQWQRWRQHVLGFPRRTRCSPCSWQHGRTQRHRLPAASCQSTSPTCWLHPTPMLSAASSGASSSQGSSQGSNSSQLSSSSSS